MPWDRRSCPRFVAKEQEHIAFTDDGTVVKTGLRREFCEAFMEHLRRP